MSIQPYQGAVASTRAVLEQVSSEQMSNDTPCASWKVNELVNHIVGGQKFFLAGVKGTPPEGAEDDFASGDYLAAFDESTSALTEALSADGAMEQTYKLPFGEMPGSALAGLVATDMFVHGWDLAKATEQSTDLNPELAAGILAASRKAIQENFRGPEGAPFGAEQPCADGACNADQLAAFLGRQV